jgi:hypothetical protein
MLRPLCVTIIILILQPVLINAQSPSPLFKDGSCPSGYHTSGQYCIPGKNAKSAIVKVGSCPSGYHSSGNYCLACNNAKAVMLKAGNSCPAGYHTSGQYCLEN